MLLQILPFGSRCWLERLGHVALLSRWASWGAEEVGPALGILVEQKGSFPGISEEDTAGSSLVVAGMAV